MKRLSLIIITLIAVNVLNIAYADMKLFGPNAHFTVDEDPTAECLKDFNKIYDENEWDFNTSEWKDTKVFQEYLDKVFNNPKDPEFKRKCLAKFIERQDIVYDKEKDHMTWKRVCDRFHPCKN